MILLSHPTGNNFSRALLAGLLKANILGRFWTSVAVRGSERWLQILPRAWSGELLRRAFNVPRCKLSTQPLRELGRMAATKAGARILTHHETGWLSWESVYHGIDRSVARNLPATTELSAITGVYCYEDAARDTFTTARNLGIRRFYDLPIAYWKTSRNLMLEEKERLPEWAITMEAARDSEKKLRRKTEELSLADIVICPSKFVYDSLPSSAKAEKQCVVAEFGSPAPRPLPNRLNRRATDPLRILFAGSMTQRKGLADVFAAIKLAKRSDIQLVVFGSPVAPISFYRNQLADFHHEATRPHEELLRLMETCDVLLLPSIVEGRALVLQEGLSCGLPLIITPNTGGEDLIEPGRTGFLVPIRSPEAIAEHIHWFADHRDRLDEMRARARSKAAEFTWEAYAAKIIAAIRP